MERQMEPCQLIERSIIKKYRKELWTPFIVAVKRYELVQAGDKIAVCISGGKDCAGGRCICDRCCRREIKLPCAFPAARTAC